MTETLRRYLGGSGGRKALRTAIWVALAFYALYLSAAALADPASGAGASAGPGAYWPTRAVGLGPDKGAIFSRPTPGDAREEIACLALNIYHEARGEPDEGKLAVSHVVMNRVASERFPGTICEVVRQGGELRRNRCQFSWWCDGRSDVPDDEQEWLRSTQVALAVYWGRSQDPTEGALWYHADYVKPAWRKDFIRGPKIGRHIFYWPQDGGPQLASRRFKS